MNIRSRDAARFFGFLTIALLVLGAAVVGFTLYERFALGASRLGTATLPLFTPYYLGRLAAIALLVLVAIAGLYRLRDPATRLHSRGLSTSKRRAVYGFLAVAMAFVILFAVEPAHFHRIALEDGP